MIKSSLAGFIIFFTCLAAFSQPEHANVISEKKSPLTNLEEFHRRDGLPNVFHKISTQHQVKIAYLGGSITAASEGWRELTFNWFRLNYPFNAFYQINSTVGGTGSLLGAFRLDGVLAEKPDLLFVEFAVNDENEMAANRRIRAMEGIVRKTWESLPNTDICFVYTTAVKFCTTLIKEGRQFDAVMDHEKIAAYYGIPSIDMGIQLAKLCKQGKVLLAADPSENAKKIVFFSNSDHYHPLTESGHPLYAHTVVKYLQKMSKREVSHKHALPVAYTAGNWQKTQLVHPEQTELAGDWIKIPENQNSELGTVPTLWKAGPGAVMKFKFDGDQLGIYDCIGPGSGILEVVLDGKSQLVNRFDGFCHYWRIHAVFLDGLQDGVHQVEIKVTGKEFDKTETIKPGQDPAGYSRFEWYPIAMLLTGKLLK